MDYESMSTGELRKLIREKGLGSGLALSGASKATCVKLLTGELTWEQYKAGAGAAFSSPTSDSTCQHETAETPVQAPAPDAVNQLGAALAALLPAQKVDMEEVRQLAVDAGHDAAINAVEGVIKAELDARLAPTKIVVEKRETGEVKDLGVTHKTMPTLLTMCQARLAGGHAPNVYLYGPAGTGKTTAARQVAKALGLAFYYNGAIGCAYEITGYRNAAGAFVETPFYQAYTKGGVYLFDELDSSNPNAVLAFNAALANGHASFACGNVPRHPDCIILAAGNTDLRGAKDGFGVRNKMDAAFRDRFVFLDWAIDHALEQAIDASYGDEWGWLARVRSFRRNAERAGVRDFEVTPRAIENGLALLKAGLPEDAVIDACVRKGLNQDTWAKVEG